MKILIILFSVLLISLIIPNTFAHQDGCHSWHSCPSDSGSYTCGDKGYCSECSNNQYCEDRQIRGYEPIQTLEREDILDDYSYFSPLRVGIIIFFVVLISIAAIGFLINNSKKK